MLLKLVRALMDNDTNFSRNHHDTFHGVKTHENGLFLYKSNQADSFLRSRAMDFFMLFGGLGLVSGYTPLLLAPILVACLSWPRKIAILTYFTFHAELLPHTEQIVFHKVGFFGGVRRMYVDIKNLEKIDASLVPSKPHFKSLISHYRQTSLGKQLVRSRHGL